MLFSLHIVADQFVTIAEGALFALGGMAAYAAGEFRKQGNSFIKEHGDLIRFIGAAAIPPITYLCLSAGAAINNSVFMGILLTPVFLGYPAIGLVAFFGLIMPGAYAGFHALRGMTYKLIGGSDE